MDRVVEGAFLARHAVVDKVAGAQIKAGPRQSVEKRNQEDGLKMRGRKPQHGATGIKEPVTASTKRLPNRSPRRPHRVRVPTCDRTTTAWVAMNCI